VIRLPAGSLPERIWLRMIFDKSQLGLSGSPVWVADQHGDPVFMVVAEPSESLAAEIRRLLPQLRQVVGECREVTVCFDRGGWCPALFADIIDARFDLLTWRKGPAPDLAASEFATVTCADNRGRAPVRRRGHHR
jgi:hypothetical protein